MSQSSYPSTIRLMFVAVQFGYQSIHYVVKLLDDDSPHVRSSTAPTAKVLELATYLPVDHS